MQRMFLIGLLLVSFSFQQSAPLTRDDTLSTLARRVTAQSESPVSAVIAALAEVIEVGTATIGTDGKATVLVKELTASNARATNKSIRLILAPAAEKGKWNWVEFEENRRLYPVERLFPYAKTQLEKLKQETEVAWKRQLDSMTGEVDAAVKVLETAKAVLKADPPPLAPVIQARTMLTEARKGTEVEAILNAHRETSNAIEPVLTLGETFADLKTNDAYLRLLEELKSAQAVVKLSRESYLKKVEVYNDEIRRLPYALVAHGMEYTKIEPKLKL
jgi:LemA protein